MTVAPPSARPSTRGLRAGLAALALSVGIIVAAVASPIAWGHGGNSKLYSSTVTGIAPPDLPIDVTVKGGDDRLRVKNLGDKTLYIYGYESDPKTGDPYVPSNLYVRIEPKGGVWVNTNSTAYQLNSDRFGTAGSTPKPGSAPVWKQVQRAIPIYEFHDHRIHWMSRQPPASVDTRDTAKQKILSWKVPVRYGDTKGEIDGRLFYIGGKPGPGMWGYLSGLLVLALVVVLVLGVRWRRSRRVDEPVAEARHRGGS